ncbi:lysophospholipid acyltransferase family protein [Nocardia camponoti]|uniref:Phospholipid/glycerol acyltransferase domain-containing protein n=1 Tax=Nocardia camponoti TaxID=1616106 RepID=A0A917QJ45_9NOCA|nr:lysophospholipid acyltransferase family protein [Nocardia camponoti]GGK53130.1 hypothetical protein GCM10011591_26160 [Nocardia camponoti]
MEAPEVLLDNSAAVYDYYLRHQQNRLRALVSYAVLARRYQPRISYAEGAKDQLNALMRSGRPVIYAINHLSENDPYTVAAAAWRSPLRRKIGRIRVLAKDELFTEPSQRAKVDMMGGIPVFRGKDHGLRAVNAAGQLMIDVAAGRLAAGDHLAIFPEGTCNDVDPATVQAVGSGIGHIAFRATKLGAPPVLVALAMSYGADARLASFHLRAPVLELPSRPAEIARFVKDELQQAVDAAIRAS